VLIGGAIVKQSVHGIAGATSKDTSSVAALIAFALLARSVHPVLAGSLRRAKAQSLRIRAAIAGRYGA